MPVVSTSHSSLRLLVSNTLGTTCLAICMFTSIHAFLSFDCGILTGFFVARDGEVKLGRSDSWKVLMDGWYWCCGAAH